ncbi:MAG TPA: type 1 glutamine amidotransferase [Casimicrobiaceae bacterium]|nr:type 1 glutamine amidotransferase [Casimicrobiaceae bacterium]
MKPVAIFRFSATEGPGHFGEWLDAQGIPWELVAFDHGEMVPADPRAFAGMAMMGGPMSANDDLPWNAPLLGLVRDAVASDVPVIGFCLGGQLFAKALGAEVKRTATPEIGWGEVTTPDPGLRGWFGGRERFTTFQWHYDVFGLPPGAKRALTNAFNLEQGFVLGKHIAMQCHVEMTREMVDSWCRTGGSELPVHSTGTMQSREAILDDAQARLAELSVVADDIFAHWSRGLAR